MFLVVCAFSRACLLLILVFCLKHTYISLFKVSVVGLIPYFVFSCDIDFRLFCGGLWGIVESFGALWGIMCFGFG